MPGKTGKKTAEPINVDELEARVKLTELRAREVEAEIRLIAAMAKRRELKADKKVRKQDNIAKGKGKKDKAQTTEAG
jgi:hypothetical protein